jgi:hypothetical protein
MALRINLYHEVTTAKALKRRDPLKLSIYGLSAIASLFAGWYFFQLMKMRGLSEELSRVQAEFSQVEPLAAAAKKKEDELTAQAGASSLLQKRIRSVTVQMHHQRALCNRRYVRAVVPLNAVPVHRFFNERLAGCVNRDQPTAQKRCQKAKAKNFLHS